MKRIGIVYNAANPASLELACALRDRLKALSYDCPLANSRNEAEILDSCAESEVLVTVGGDGTILRTAKLAVVLGAPILGVNMGKLGFMTEMRGADALERVPDYLKPGVWVEERATLDVEVTREGESLTDWALNEAVVSRGGVAQLITVRAYVDGAFLAVYRADGVILATATGSTGYAMAVGGPVLEPQSRQLVLAPVSPHLSMATPLVLGEESRVALEIAGGGGAVVSLDGHNDHDLGPGDVVRASKSAKTAKFLRARKPPYFFETLAQRLGLDRLPGAAAAGPP